jgi:hypothetical protein
MIGRGRPSRPDAACPLHITIFVLPLRAPHPTPLACSHPSRAAPARAEPRPVLVLACVPPLALVVLTPPVARAARAVELSPVLVALVVVVLACSRSPPTPILTAGINRPWPPLYCKTHVSTISDILQVCSNCFIWVL